ncbi:MAG: hypothetical protein ACP5Q3_12765 [bacterium]
MPTLSWAKDRNPPLGEIVVRGEVQVEVKTNVWQNIEFSHYPLFPGMKIKTKKGLANIFLKNHSHVELNKDSLLAIESADHLRLLQGKIDFRIPASANLKLHLGNLVVQKTPFQQAAQRNYLPSEEVLGTLTLHAHGAVTIYSLQGKISILDQNQRVLAALSPKDSLTIPSTLASKPPQEKTVPIKIAQVGEEEVAAEPEKYAGISVKTWGIIGLAALGATGALIAAGGGGGGGGGAPACP